MKRNVLLSDSEDDWNQSLDSIRKIFINSRIQKMVDLQVQVNRQTKELRLISNIKGDSFRLNLNTN